ISTRAQDAPSLAVVGDSQPGGGRGITGPASWPRSGGPPTFQVSPAPNQFYSVEFTSDRALFDNAAGRTANNHYASWTDTSFMNAATYAMPQAVWDRLRGASTLFYRAHTSSSNTAWTNYQITNTSQNAPSMELSGARSSRMEGFAPMAPSAPAENQPSIAAFAT